MDIQPLVDGAAPVTVVGILWWVVSTAIKNLKGEINRLEVKVDKYIEKSDLRWEDILKHLGGKDVS